MNRISGEYKIVNKRAVIVNDPNGLGIELMLTMVALVGREFYVNGIPLDRVIVWEDDDLVHVSATLPQWLAVRQYLEDGGG